MENNKLQRQISVKEYKSDGFVRHYQNLVRDTVLSYQYDVLCDKAEGAEKSHVIQNFINAGKALHGEDTGSGFYGMVFQDSDAAKWLEAAAYSLSCHYDKELENKADALIDIIAEAQDEDGYLNTRFTIKDKDKRWQNLTEGHELYCAGHMMEAACAYYEAVGKDKLLKVMLKNAEHIYNRFVKEKKEGFPGHPEIELALMKMYRLTGNAHCLELAEHFINVRGVDPEFYEKEAKKRDWTVWGNNVSDTDYSQCGRPVREQTKAAGHAVRAVYLYTGMADLAGETGDKELFSACEKLWESITQRQMYITGGIGSTVHGEAFSVDYDLPPDTAYAETCASIGLIFFASRMLELDIDGKYGDIMERAFYNTVLAGMQMDGKRFFYVNPLECVPGISGVSPTHRHDLTVRPKWYACACCPPNAARLISSLGKYAYGENKDTAFCHLFASGEVKFKNGIAFNCVTDYPYGFKIKYEVINGGKIAVRIPEWSGKYTLTINEKLKEINPEKGYIYIDANSGDTVELNLDDTPKFVYGNLNAPRLTGKTAIIRGPLVYCFEGADNNGGVLSLALVRRGKIKVHDIKEGIVKLSAEAVKRENFNTLYSYAPPKETPFEAVAVPYYTWANRGENQMRVWMDEIIKE